MSDLIDRNMAITHVNAVLFPKINTAKEAEKALRELPAIDAVPVRHGKWILVHEADETGNATYECSICHRGEIHVPIVEVGYCWHCGADMRGGTDETD